MEWLNKLLYINQTFVSSDGSVFQIPLLPGIEGNLSAKLIRRIEGNVCHFLTITEWDSYESIKQFAGNDYQKAKYYPEDKDYLLKFEEEVTHHETFEY